MRFYIYTLIFLLVFSMPAVAVDYDCPCTQKFDRYHTYTAEELRNGQFRTIIWEKPDGIFLSRCSFSPSQGKVTCDTYKVDHVEIDTNINARKYYLFNSQCNFQIFSDLTCVEDNGRGGIQFGECEIVH